MLNIANTGLMNHLAVIQKKWARRGEWTGRFLDLMDTTPRFGWAVGLALMAISLIPKFSHDLNADSTVYLYLAGRMLDGAHYYDDFFEFNTPFAIGLYAIPVAIARLCHIFVPIAGKIFISCLTLGSIVLTHCIIRRSREWAPVTRYNAIIITLFFALNFPSSFYYNELTTKTPIFLCFILPYFFSVQLKAERIALARWLQIVTGLLLGLTLCLKPHYVLFAIIMEGYLAVKSRDYFLWLRWPNLLAGLVATVYYIFILPVFFPGYLRIIPFFFEYYDAAYYGWQDRVVEIFTYLFYGLPFLLWYLPLRKFLDRVASYGIFFAGIGASILILTTETLLSHDQRSILNFFICLPYLYSFLIFLRQLDTFGAAMSTRQRCVATLTIMLGALTIFGLVNVISAFDPRPRDREQVTAQMLDYIHRYAADDPLFTLSDNTEHFAPEMLYLSKRPYPVFHLQRMFFNLENRHYDYRGEALPESTQKAEAYIAQSLMRFFTRTPPKLVFVRSYSWYSEHQIKGYCLPGLLEILLRRYPEFKSLWNAHYQRIGTILSTPEQKILEDRPLRKVELKFGDKPYQATFPPRVPIATWLDVYVRKD